MSRQVTMKPPVVKQPGVGFRSSDEDWYSKYEDDLLDIWHELEESIKKKGVVLLDRCRFNHFYEFVLSLTTTQRDRCVS